ncbi:hypothetical protein L1987_83966 [Smallanthus sonchifolius]|uniref:Uncharacterized protein n=1 Tax=Smallanthus sonchifolius TaxID=185202 RepID=A0ACB8YCS1_9ASTR|nr:hypothetical protein L1987_83966 [Smallanthus sonchifolius]
MNAHNRLRINGFSVIRKVVYLKIAMSRKRLSWAKFGGYGSFLPTYQRSPAGPHSKTSPKVHVNNTSPNDLHLQNGLGKVEVLTIQQMRNVYVTYRVTIYGTDAELDLHIPFMMFQSKKTARNGLD